MPLALTTGTWMAMVVGLLVYIFIAYGLARLNAPLWAQAIALILFVLVWFVGIS